MDSVISVDLKKCPIHSVMVYSDKAEITRIANVDVSVGECNIEVNDFPDSVDRDSGRVEVKGAAQILDVIYGEKDIPPDTKNDKKDALQKRIDEKKEEINESSSVIGLLKKQQEMLKDYAQNVTSLLSGNLDKEDTPLFSDMIASEDVAIMMKFMERYQTTLSTLDQRLLDAERHKVDLEDQKKVLEAERQVIIGEESAFAALTLKFISVVVEAKESGTIQLDITYTVNNASWSPFYDIRVFTKDKVMKVYYHGLIKQATGEDWVDANISLSTAQPNIGGAPPQLGIHHIGFMHSLPFAIPKSRNRRVPSITYSEDDSFSDDSVQEEFQAISKGAKKKGKRRMKRRASISESFEAESLSIEVAKVELGQLFNMTYSIPRKSTIPSDNTEHKVTVAVFDLKPDFKHICVPRLSPYCFLQSVVKNESHYALLAGPANVFIDNNFLSKSLLSDVSPGEEFSTSLGVDQSITINCHPVKVIRGTTGRLTKSNQLIYTYVYTAKNCQANNVDLTLSEQVPLSTDEKLKLIIQTPEIKKCGVPVQFAYGRSVLNEDNNIEWHCVLPPDTAIDLELTYAIEFPLNSIVEGLPKQ